MGRTNLGELIARTTGNTVAEIREFMLGLDTPVLLRFLHAFYLSVNEDGSLGCYAPTGPDPTSDQEDALDRRIESALPLVPGAIIRAMQRENPANNVPVPEGDS